MKRIAFIAERVEEGKIKLVEASEDIAASYNEKSKNAKIAADLLLQNSLLEEATSMFYYNMYHKVTALFYSVGLKCENHAATIILLKELFGIDNESISFAKKERIDKQYYTEFHVTQEQVKELRTIAEEFNAMMDQFIDRITNEQKQQFQETFRRTYK